MGKDIRQGFLGSSRQKREVKQIDTNKKMNCHKRSFGSFGGFRTQWGGENVLSAEKERGREGESLCKKITQHSLSLFPL